MNKKTKNLLNKAIEECSKLTQYCSKAIQFGLFSSHPNKKKTNGDEILVKYYRLQAIIEELQKENVLPRYGYDYIIKIKQNSINDIKNKK